jgi:hypothetical protein
VEGGHWFCRSLLLLHLVSQGSRPGWTFLQQLFGTPISTFFAVDLLISSVVFVRYLGHEAVRYSIGRQWLYLVALLTVGLSLASPLLLHVRESRPEART